MAKYADLELRLKRAFAAVPEPTLSEELGARLESVLRAPRVQPDVVAVGYARLEQALAASYRTAATSESDLTDTTAKVMQRVGDSSLREGDALTAAFAALDKRVGTPLPEQLAASLLRKIRTSTAISDGEPEFGQRARLFASIIAPFSVALFLFTVSAQSWVDESLRTELQLLFGEREGI